MSRTSTRHPRPADPETGPSGLPRGRAPSDRLTLRFKHMDDIAHVSDPIWKDVSSVAVAGRSIFCACDETSSVERVLHAPEKGEAAAHASFPIGAVFDLPDGPGGEMDIEGLDISDGWLWVTGSHSLKRKDPKPGKLRRMEKTSWDPNRAFLGRLPLVDRGAGVFEPVARDGQRRARMVKLGGSRDSWLRKALRKDSLLGPFADLPCKENGLDIEGLAARGRTVLLGLRGPALRGWALILRLEMKEARDGFLKPRKLADGRRYAVHAVDLGGHGVRDMCWDGERLLILSGATTDLTSLQSVWTLDRFDPGREVWEAGRVGRELDLPALRAADNAEGIALLGDPGEGRRLLVAHDSPHPDRTPPKTQSLTADLFDYSD
ncbi:MAG: hypothetical protein CML43_08635 [Rhodobacteraceae bacterium]|nr:hypothetical protein [Paracoccaceae bacterium]